ncbi:MAG: hypothetical protein ACI8UO_002016 [Verrucomicrobiales bacterium]|jgi:hypothetical protein
MRTRKKTILTLASTTLALALSLLPGWAFGQDAQTGEFASRSWSFAKGQTCTLLDDLGWGIEIEVDSTGKIVQVPKAKSMIDEDDASYLDDRWEVAKPRGITAHGPFSAELVRDSFKNQLWRALVRERRGIGESPDLQLIVRKSDPESRKADFEVLLVQPDGFGLVWWTRIIDESNGANTPLEVLVTGADADAVAARKAELEKEQQ